MLKYFGHSCFSITMGGKILLFDPFISGNSLASHISIGQIEADYMLISHGHADHVGDCIELAKKTKATVISNYEIINWLKSKGIEGIAMNQGGKLDTDFGTVKMVYAAHSSSLPDGSYGGHSNGFVLWNSELCFYFAGDTALSMEMKLIPLTCPKLDFAIFPIGDLYTMGADDAILASQFCEVNTVIGAHFDSFPGIKIDHDACVQKFATRSKRLIIPKIGETVNWN
ncbi:MAG: metal-dependent hydrolase [Saprospiraceae bacterium]|nr:metal-dependent hydrolase [Saprospiraceae bacterium]